jgi:uncharacterized membrane protein
MAWLVFFIHHIVRNIQANHLVDLIARESEAVLDAVFAREPTAPSPEPAGWRALTPRRITADRSGYVQLVDLDALADVAAAAGGVCESELAMGHFATEGATLATVFSARALRPEEVDAVRGAFDLGPLRTMQDDAEFGVRQIVDIALKAISPAVNDPSTAVTCIDQLSRLLVRIAPRPDPRDSCARDATVRVRLRVTSFESMVDLAFTQIRQYGKADMAVGLRLLRSLDVVAEVTEDPARKAVLARHARLIEAALRSRFPPEDCRALDLRVTALREELAAPPEVTPPDA